MLQLTFSPQKIFLIDGLGAISTALFLGGVLVRWYDIFGMSPTLLYGLAAMVCFYAIFSFSCYFYFKKILATWKKYLKILAIANLLYCVFTFSLMIYFFQQLTFWGLFYFSAEIMVILLLVIFEFKQSFE